MTGEQVDAIEAAQPVVASAHPTLPDICDANSCRKHGVSIGTCCPCCPGWASITARRAHQRLKEHDDMSTTPDTGRVTHVRANVMLDSSTGLSISEVNWAADEPRHAGVITATKSGHGLNTWSIVR